MNFFTLHKVTLVIAALFIACMGYSQPFVDPVNFSSQFFSSTYKDSTKARNNTNDYILNIFLPKEFKNGNAFLIRLNGEQLHTERYSSGSSQSYDLYAFSLPVGFQFASENKKWRLMLVATPKISSDFKNAHYNDLQLGGTVLGTYNVKDNLKFRLGLYYNREFFGNFFVPLIGMDWKVNDRLNLYGVLPSFYRIEYRLNKFMYTGLGFRSATRSYRLAYNLSSDFIWAREQSLKLFLDFYITKKVILFAEGGYTLRFQFVQYRHGTQTESNTNPIYAPLNNGFFFLGGLAFRIRRE